MLDFRRKLLEAGTVEGCYLRSSARRSTSRRCSSISWRTWSCATSSTAATTRCKLRAGELFFRDQKATIQDGHVLLADLETVEMHASGHRYGSIGRLIVEAQGELATANLDVLDRNNAALYWERESRHDTVISLTYGRPALDALCRVMEAWVFHFENRGARNAHPQDRRRALGRHRARRRVDRDPERAGADARSSRADAQYPRAFRARVRRRARCAPRFRGRTVYLALAAEDGVVKMKPQNLLPIFRSMKPGYWDRAKRALRRKDAVMSSIMQRHKGIYLVRRGEPFLTLARAIVGQQISVKAAQSVWDRVVACARNNAGRHPAEKAERAARCGLSDRKTEYIVDLARRFAEGSCIRIAGTRWATSDRGSGQVRGIGRWTAEMFLIFNLLRPDISRSTISGCRKESASAISKGESLARAHAKLGESWRPWRSVATWYLWRSLDPVPVEY